MTLSLHAAMVMVRAKRKVSLEETVLKVIAAKKVDATIIIHAQLVTAETLLASHKAVDLAQTTAIDNLYLSFIHISSSLFLKRLLIFKERLNDYF